MINRKFFALLILCCLLFSYQTAVAVRANDFFISESAAEKFYRTELYFGTQKPDGGFVSDEDWSLFLSEEVTPRFPAGFTVLEGFGQYRDSKDKIVKEKSRCLILFYPKSVRKANDRKIEEIRAAYKTDFRQESVLRLDFRQSVSVSF